MGFWDAIYYIYRFEIMILLRVKTKSLLCYWVVRDLKQKNSHRWCEKLAGQKISL